MTKQEAIKPQHGNIYAALAAAQMEMGKALKQSENPHFRKKYADLGNVMDACLPSLNKNGIAVAQPVAEVEGARYVKTVFYHETGENIETLVPLIVQKNDMQGLGSAITYARRYGLMCLAGIAPEDDDGNAAAKAAPVKNEAPRTVSPDQFVKLRDLAEEAGVDAEKICERFGASSLEQFPASKFPKAIAALQKTLDSKQPAPANADLAGDEIPY